MTQSAPDPETQFCELLVKYDEELAASADGTIIGTQPHPSELSPTDLQQRLVRVQTCLQLLDQDRRRLSASSIRVGTDAEPELEPTPEVSGDFSSMPRQIGRFRLIRRLGSGGFGMVFLAEDPTLQRLVAVKIPRPETLATPDLQRRFMQESRLAARLTHPNLVPVYEASQTESFSYQVTAYCAGGTLSQWLSQTNLPSTASTPSEHHGAENAPGGRPVQRRLPINVAVELLTTLADGVQYAHEHGILHRDLKPSNILLQPRGEVLPDAGGSIVPHSVPLEKLCTTFQPMIADFGLAKLFASVETASESLNTDQVSAAQLTTVAGTPQYMAPEQFACNARNIGPATDVYALGSILYEVLAGRSVFPETSVKRLWLQVADLRPTPLREQRPEIPKDLEAVCMKCLAKTVAERYQSARELADDLRAFSRGDAVVARPWPWSEQLVKWSKQRPAIASLVLFSSLLMLGLLSFSAWHVTQLNDLNDRLVATVVELETQTDAAQRQTQRANDQARIAREKEELALLHSNRTEEFAWVARTSAYSANLLRAAERFQAGKIPQIGAILQEQRLHPGDANVRGFEWHYLWSLGRNMRELQGHTTAAICAAALTPDGKTCFAISEDGTIRRWAARTGVLQDTWIIPGKGHAIAKINQDATRAILRRNGRNETLPMVIAWNLRRGQTLRQQEFSTLAIADVEIAPDGTWGLIGGQTDGHIPSPVFLWSIESGAMTRIELPDSFQNPSYGVNQIAISPDGEECAVAVHSSRDGLSWLHQLFRAVIRFDAIDPASSGTGSSGRAPRISEWICLKPPSDGIEKALKYSPDGEKILLTISHHQGGRIEAWSRHSSRLLDAIDDTMRHVDEIAFETPEQTLALSGVVEDARTDQNSETSDVEVSATSRPELTFWKAGQKNFEPTSYSARERITSINFHEPSRMWVIGEDDGRLSLWRPEPVPLYRELPGHQPREAWGVAFSPDGATIYSVGDDSLLRAWSVETGLQTGTGIHHTSLISCVAVSPDGRWVATGSYDDDVVVWNADSLSVHAVLKGHAHDIRTVAFSVDGTMLASAGRDQSIRRWSVPEGQLLAVHDQQESTIRATAFIGNHKLIQGNAEGQITIYNRNGESELLRDELHSEEVYCLTVAPAGLRWRLDGGSVIPLQADLIQSAAENELLLYGCKHGAVRLLHIPTTQVLFETHLAANEIRSVAFSPDGRTFAAAGDDNAVHLFHVATSHEVLTFANLPAAVNQVAFSSDGRHLAAALHDGTVRLWTAPRDP